MQALYTKGFTSFVKKALDLITAGIRLIMPLTRRMALAGSAFVATSLSAPRIGRGQNHSRLRFVPQSDLSVLDPVLTGAYVTRNHGMMVFDTLYGMDAAYRIRPQMVAGHSVEDDGHTWLLTLRPNLTWHDGEPVLARDCVASIQRWGIRDSLGQTLLAATAELTAVNDRQLRFRLRHPFPLLPYALGKPGTPVCFMMPERLAATDPYKPVAEMVGSGPFRFNPGERVVGARVVYDRNPAYVAREEPSSFTAGSKQAFMDRVEWQVLPDPSTAAAALMAGEVDWWEAPGFDLLPLLARNPDIRLDVPDKTGFIGTMRMNHLQPPFDNPALRRAVLPALRQADFMTAVAGEAPGSWHDGVGFFCPGTPMASDAGMDALRAPRDVEKARRAVAASGYAGQPAALLAPSDFPNLKALADIGADLLTRIGIKVDYQAMDWGSVLQRVAKTEPVEQGGWSVFHTFWSGLDQLNPAVNSSLRANGAQAGRGWPSSEALERLRDRWIAAPDEATQGRIAEQIQRQAFEDLPYIPLGQMMQRTAYRRDIVGVPSGFAAFWGVKRG
ncbi:ABC transporter, substrate-binding protein, family 5 [Acetobacteraceae bacterium AT-5844]|nr:ABC transporter, substrate-binding protein, family 5 [Acetobacteraceae bacterium AT-5844]